MLDAPQEDATLIDARLLVRDGQGDVVLLAGRNRMTGAIAFPLPDDEDRFETITLPREGRLWSWTVQRFRPKSPPYAGPEAFEPYAVGYVALGEALIVEGRLTGAPINQFAIDMPMTLVAQAFTRMDGEVRTTFAFSPTALAA